MNNVTAEGLKHLISKVRELGNISDMRTDEVHLSTY